MSVASQIARIQNDRNTMRTKLVDLGLVQATADLDDIALAVSGIENRGAVSASVQQGSTYTIPKGYHNGSGTVSGVSGGGDYSLQDKTISPTKSQQQVTPDQGYYGLSSVTINAIPSNYNDTSSVTATAANVLANKIIIDSAGKTVVGTMTNNGAVTKTLDTTTTSFTIPAGYHSGAGAVNISTETKQATPTKSQQIISPTSGKVLSGVTVKAIPADYITTTDATAIAASILFGETAYVNGSKVTGLMPNNGTISSSIDGLTTTSYTIAEGYTAGGTISLTSDIENALSAI